MFIGRGKLIVFAAIILSAAFFIMPKIAQAEIIINEIMYDLAGTDDKYEWVELYNNGPVATDLTDWKINDGDSTTNHGLNVPPKNNSRGSIILDADSYALLTDDAATIAADLPGYAGTIIDTVLNLPNTGATLKLIDKNGVEINTATYSKDLGAAGNGRTLERDGTMFKESLIDGGTPGQINSVLTNDSAVPGTMPSASPTTTTIPSSTTTSSATPSPSPTAKSFDYSQNIFLNEFLPWPENNEKEWVELFNAGPEIVNLSGWQINNADNSTAPQMIPEDAEIAAGQFLVISFNKNILNNDGDKIRLLWPDDQIVHTVSYGKAAQGQAAAKFVSGWLWTSQPTPGQINKKSFFIEEAAPSMANTNKINPTEENVIASAQPQNKTASVRQTINLQTSLPTTQPSVVPPDNINLTAAASEPIKQTSNLNAVLIFGGVILFAALAAGGLIYFKRLKSVDSKNFDN